MVETLAIKHTDYLKRVSDFLKSDFIIEDNEIQIETILISSYASLGYNSNLEADYQNSIHRKIILNFPKIQDLLWDEIERRFQELQKNDNDAIIERMTRNVPFDIALNFNTKIYSNPVQDFLIEKLGFRMYESADFYQKLQIGYTRGGIEGAKLAYNDVLKKELDMLILKFVSTLNSFQKVQGVILQDQLMII